MFGVNAFYAVFVCMCRVNHVQVSKPLLFQTLCFAVGVKFTEGAIASAQDAAYFERQTPFSSADIAVRARNVELCGGCACVYVCCLYLSVCICLYLSLSCLSV